VHVRLTPKADKECTSRLGLLCADFVAEVAEEERPVGAELEAYAVTRSVRAVAGDYANDCQRFNPYATDGTDSGGGRATSMANLRRFWAIAASVNSN